MSILLDDLFLCYILMHLQRKKLPFYVFHYYFLISVLYVFLFFLFYRIF